MIPVQPLFVDTATTQKMLGIGKTKVFELLKSKKLKRVKIGTKTLVTVESINTLAASLEAA